MEKDPKKTKKKKKEKHKTIRALAGWRPKNILLRSRFTLTSKITHKSI